MHFVQIKCIGIAICQSFTIHTVHFSNGGVRHFPNQLVVIFIF